MQLDPTIREDYDILTALRGPDLNTSGNYEVKSVTTSVLRYFVGMRVSTCPQAIINSPAQAREFWGWKDEDEKADAKKFIVESWHFEEHVRRAFKSLLKKAEVNGDLDLLHEVNTYYIWLKENVL